MRKMLIGRAAIGAAMMALAAAAMAQSSSDRPSDLPSGPANDRFMQGHYPARALARGENGLVGFTVSLNRKGKLETCRVTRSSGYRGLDNETCELIAFYARFRPGRDDDGRATASTVTGSVRWGQADADAARVQTVAYPAEHADKDALICRRTPKTGSNYVKVKECRTAHDWELHYEEMRTLTAKMRAGERDTAL